MRLAADWCYSPKVLPALRHVLRKTATNAWATTHRYHETRRLQCISGCPDAPDTIHHYTTGCCLFWRSIYHRAGTNYHDDPLMRLGVAAPSLQAIRVIAIAYTTYHAIRNVDAAIILKADDTGDYSAVHSKLAHHAAIAAKKVTCLFQGALLNETRQHAECNDLGLSYDQAAYLAHAFVEQVTFRLVPAVRTDELGTS